MQMEGTIKEELYSEALRFSNLDVGVRSGTNNGNHNAHGKKCSSENFFFFVQLILNGNNGIIHVI